MTVAARDLVGLPDQFPAAAAAYVCDSLVHARDIASHFGVAACTWPGKRAHWRQAHWSRLYGRTVTLIACASAASRKRMEELADHLTEHECNVFVALPSGSGGDGPADWCAAGVEEARATIKALRREWKPVAAPAQEVSTWVPPDTTTEWAVRNEHYEVFGVEGEHVAVRVGTETHLVLDTRLSSPSKLRTLAPLPFWHRHTGAEKMSRDLAETLGWMLLEGARENGPLYEYDLDTDLVGIPGDRVLRLSTGDIRARTRADRVMRSLAVEPIEGEPSLWLETLHSMLDHSGERDWIIEYLRQWFRRSLTTDCSDESLLMFHGQPGGGKSTLMDTWCHIAGTYCHSLPGSYLVGSGVATVRHLIARLRGARVIRVGELPESGRWSASEDVNALVSGETLVADQKHHDAMEFRSIGHFVVSANRVPKAHPSSGIYRRLRILQLKPIEAVDPTLKARLREPDEAGRILSWALCTTAQDDGGRAHSPSRWVDPPPSMRAPVEEMRRVEDVIGQWIADLCVSSADSMTESAQLYQSFIGYLGDNELGCPNDWNINKFSRQITQIGKYPSYVKSGGIRCRIGIALK